MWGKKNPLNFFFFTFKKAGLTGRNQIYLPSWGGGGCVEYMYMKLDFQGNGHQALKDSYPWEIGNKQGESLLSLPSLYLPSLQTKERAWVNDRDISGLIDGSNLTCLKQGLGATPPPSASEGGQDKAAVFATRGGGKLTSGWLRETSRGTCLSLSLW